MDTTINIDGHAGDGAGRFKSGDLIKFASHDKVYMINIACINGVKPFELENIMVNDGTNHTLDKKK